MNDTFTSVTKLTTEPDLEELDRLFKTTRESEPALSDDNFTKMVLNSLPADSQRGLLARNTSRSGISFDLLGLFVGVLCAYMFVEMRTVLEFVLSFVPESLVISPLVLAAALGSTIALSLTAWWTVEHGNRV